LTLRIIINIDVPEIEAAVRFYTAALGLAHTRTLDDDTAELTGAAATIYLLRKDPGSAAVQAPPVTREYQRHWTPVHFDLVVDDVDAAAERAGCGREAGDRAHRLAWLALPEFQRPLRPRLLLHPVRERHLPGLVIRAGPRPRYQPGSDEY
jgi:predicted enzyme related to lactoylglutathione lyase